MPRYFAAFCINRRAERLQARQFYREFWIEPVSKILKNHENCEYHLSFYSFKNLGTYSTHFWYSKIKWESDMSLFFKWKHYNINVFDYFRPLFLFLLPYLWLMLVPTIHFSMDCKFGSFSDCLLIMNYSINCFPFMTFVI